MNVTSHKAPLSTVQVAILAAVVIATVVALLFVVRLGLVGVTPDGQVRFFGWGYCLLESLGCVPS